MAKQKSKKSPQPEALKRMGHDEVPATVGLVNKVRAELLAETRAVRHEMTAMEKRIDARFISMEGKFDGKFAQLEEKFAQSDVKSDEKFALVDARFESIEGSLDQLTAEVHRSNVLAEQQRAENRIVLDGLKLVLERQDRMDAERPR